jgi:hypothetical protein
LCGAESEASAGQGHPRAYEQPSLCFVTIIGDIDMPRSARGPPLWAIVWTFEQVFILRNHFSNYKQTGYEQTEITAPVPLTNWVGELQN